MYSLQGQVGVERGQGGWGSSSASVGCHAAWPSGYVTPPVTCVLAVCVYLVNSSDAWNVAAFLTGAGMVRVKSPAHWE